ncbi:unnamed protein product [Calypogeia fissa]
MATAAAVGSQLASVAALSSAQQISASGISMRVLSRSTGLGMPTIECAKHPQKKATAHHNKTRPKKHNPYDIISTKLELAFLQAIQFTTTSDCYTANRK